MKARRFFAFVAGAAMLFGMGGCTEPDKELGNSPEATISVSPKFFATTFAGGSHEIAVTSNATWSVSCDDASVEITPTTGSDNGTVTVTIPAATTEVERYFSIKFYAEKEAVTEGVPYHTDDEAFVTVLQNESGKVTTNVKEVRELLKAVATSTEAAVPAEIASKTLTGIVVGSGTHGNMNSNKALAVQDDSTEPHSGLTLRFASNVDIPHGSIVQVSLAGAKTQVYNGLLQLSPVTEPVVYADAFTVEPVAISYSDLLNYESQYVKLSGLHALTAGVVWSDGTQNTTHKFVDLNNNSVTIWVSKFAKFASKLIPQKSGTIAGIASVYNSDKQLQPQSLSDIQLTEEIVEPEAVTATIAEVLENGGGKYIVNNAWVVATYTAGCLLTDDSAAYILAYNPSETPAVGTVVSIEGDVSAYNDVLQFSKGAVITATGETKEVSHPTAEVLDGAAIDAYFTTPVVKYAEFTGVLTVSGNYYNVAVEGATVVGSVSNPNTDIADELKQLDGVPVKVTGYMIGKSTSKGTNYANIMATSVEADTSKPILKADDITGVSADGVVGANANITVVGIDAVATEVDGAVVTAASVTGNVLTYTVSPNETEEAREGWIELSAAGVETVEIAVKQKGVQVGNFVDDVLNLAFTGVSGTNYVGWSNKAGESGAVYAGQSAGDKESIQLRSKNSNSGIVTTATGGKVRKVVVTWQADTAEGRTLDIYGSNEAYTSPTELYGDLLKGEKLGTIVKGTSTELEITGDYAFIGMRSNNAAMYLTDITISWEK